MAEKKKGFHWRGWTTFVVTLSFVIDTVSGIILYIAPPGRVAHWTNWKIWGLTKDQWAAVHTIFGFVLLVIVALHLYYNWKIFIAFLWNTMKKALHLKRELALSIAVCLVLFLGSIWSIPPFGTIMDIGEKFKESWEQSRVKPPVAHAELLSLADFAGSIQVPVEQITKILTSKGYSTEGAHQTIRDIALANRVSPEKLYAEIQAGGLMPAPAKSSGGSGMGRKTIRTVCEEQGLSLEEVLTRLEKLKLDAKPDDRLKDLAERLGKTPTELLHIILDT